MANFDERIQKLAAARRVPSRAVFPFLGEEVLVAVRLLSDHEIDRCRVDAAQWTEAKAKALKMSSRDLLAIDANILDRELQRRTIAKAFLDVDTLEQERPEPFFANTDEVARLDALTIDTLTEIYLDHQNAMNPLHGLDDEQAEEFFDALGKAFEDPLGPNLDRVLATLDAPTLRRLLRISVVRRASSTIGK